LADAGHAVRIRTAALPQETTSRAAGAIWGSTFAGPADKVTGWAAVSLEDFRALAAQPDTGVAIASGTLASGSGGAPPPQMFPGVEIRPCDPPGGFAAGFRITLPVIDMPRYLDYLVARLRDAAVEIEPRPVRSLTEAASEAPIVVNCAGLGARDLAGDPTLRPARGQHVVVENPGVKEFFMTEPFGPAWTSWVPHGDRVVLGGVAQEDDWDLKPRQRTLSGSLRVARRSSRASATRASSSSRSDSDRCAMRCVSKSSSSVRRAACTTTVTAAPASASRGDALAKWSR
jgi:D-amino-acid oxidase